MQGSGERSGLIAGSVQNENPKNAKRPATDSLQVKWKRIALGSWFLSYMPIFRCYPRISYQTLAFMLTFACYASYHMTRKTFGVVKSVFSPNCSQRNDTCSVISSAGNGWEPFNGDHCETLLGVVDDSWSFAYAIAMFGSGIIAERVDLRYFLTIGMIGSAVSTGLLGVAYYAHIHHLYYFVLIQVFSGVMQSTGWPGTVAVMGNWFGIKGRGLFMGLWNTHTSVGNILGTVIPALWTGPNESWAWSFIVPAFIMIGVAIIIFLFLVVDPQDIGQEPPAHHLKQERFRHQQRPSQVSNPSPTSDYGSVASPLLSSDEEEDKMKNKSPIISDYIKAVSPARILKNNDDGAIGFVGALMIPGVIEYSLALFFSKLVAYTFLFWLPYYVDSAPIGSRCLTNKEASFLSTLFDFGGIFGGILTGALSDIINARAITCTLMLYLSVPTLFLYHFVGNYSLTTFVILLLLCGFFVNGPYACITTAVSSDLGTHKSLRGSQKAKATVSAIIDGTGSIGAALGPLLTGLISDYSSWKEVFYLLMVSCFLSSLFLTRLVINEIRMYIAKYKSKRVD